MSDSAEVMSAAVLHGRRDLRVERVPVPAARPGEVLIKVEAAGLCGTDAAEFVNGPSMFPVHERHPVTGHLGPMIIGHEFAGTVVETGEGVEPAVWLDAAVASCAAVSCGACWQCDYGRPNLCPAYVGVGLHRDGALAEFVSAPIEALLPIGDLSLTFDSAALCQPMAVAVHARDRGKVRAGDRVVVIGVGGIGGFLVYALRAAGCTVVGLDASAARLDLALALGAASAHLASAATPETVSAALSGPPHVVFEASGRTEALDLAMHLLPAGGRLVAVGLQPRARELDFRRMTLTETEFVGTNALAYDVDFPRALDLVASRAAGWSDIAPSVMTLEEAMREGIPALAAGRSPSVKLLVDPRASTGRAAITQAAPA